MRPLQLRNILIATDLRPEMIPALRSARELAELAGAMLHVFHAAERTATSPALQDKIAQTKAELGGTFDVSVSPGPAAALITQEAARTEADVIVLGRHRNQAGAPGSTADRVVRNAHVPCLILPDRLRLPLTSVLVPVDITEAASGALAVGLAWASALRRRSANDADATCVHTIHVHSETHGSAHEDARARLEAEVKTIERRLSTIAGVSIEYAVEHGRDIGRTILDQAARQNADLIVIGTRAERIDADHLGSVSSIVVKHADYPVLLVPPETWHADAEEIAW